MSGNLSNLFQRYRLLEQRAGDGQLSITQPTSRGFREHRLTRREDGRLELSFYGLYGRFGVLPDYFTDQLLIDQDEQQALHNFLDLFNGRVFRALLHIWSRYRFFTDDLLRPKTERAKKEAWYLNRLSGSLADREDPLHFRGLRWNQISLYRHRPRTKLGLEHLLTAFFPGLRIQIQSFVPAYRPIPPEQQARLGGNTLCLGAQGNFITGTKIKDIGGTVRLWFRQLDYDAYERLLPGGAWRRELTRLFKDYTRGNLDCLIRLELRREEVPHWQLGGGRLGHHHWLVSQPPAEPVNVDAGGL